MVNRSAHALLSILLSGPVQAGLIRAIRREVMMTEPIAKAWTRNGDEGERVRSSKK